MRGLRFMVKTAVAVLLAASAVGVSADVANAAEEAPKWRLDALGNTAVRPGATETLQVEIVNLGTTPSSGPYTIKAVLPPGLIPISGTPLFGEPRIPCVVNAAAGTIECESAFVRGHGYINSTTFVMKATSELGPKVVHFEVSGGGAPNVRKVKVVQVQPAPVEAGIEGFDGLIADANGQQFTQAGGHPYDIITRFVVNTHTDFDQPPPRGALPGSRDGVPVEPVKDIFVNLPPGLLGNIKNVGKCSAAQLTERATFLQTIIDCPANSQIGTLYIMWKDRGGVVAGPLQLFNMIAPAGFPARFGFVILGVPIYLNASLRYNSDYGVTVSSPDIGQVLPIAGFETHFWGVPTSEVHTPERNCPGGQEGETCASGAPATPFIRMPTSCTPEGQGLKWTAYTDTWPLPGALDQLGLPLVGDANWKSTSYETHDPPFYPFGIGAEQGPVKGSEGCDRVPVHGILKASPTAIEAETSSGLLVHVEVPNPGLENPEGISTSDTKDVKFSLPVGVTINPSQGEGLGVCTPAQWASTQLSFHPDPSKGCPSNSKIGTVVLHTQLLEDAIEGNVYLAQPYKNPFKTLVAIYLVFENPNRGILVKQPGRIELDPVTGQITTTIENIPQLEFSDFSFKYREGARAPLVTPPVCGSYANRAVFTPWSDPSHTVESLSSFQIVHGIGGGTCPPGGTPPFNPEVVSGTSNNNAASNSPFTLRISRHDGEQELTKYTTILPPGLTGNLNGIPFCPDSAIETARHRTGQRELAEPSCPLASEIGHSFVGAGVGSVLAHTPGKIYLAGPYHGAQLSIVSITSATVGPFDLGTVVIRFALRINPTTAQVEVDSAGSDPIPHIIDGVVVHVREIRVYMDRPGFIRNPTNCDPLAITDAITGAGADYTNPADQDTVNVTTRFQAANCSLLGFKPTFSVSTSGKTSRANGASLHAKLTYPRAPEGTQANIAYVKVSLPKQLPSRLTTLQHACADATFNQNPAMCPVDSRVGTAKAITPILPVPLEGPAYFVSHGGLKFPELIIVLQGYGFTIDLHGETFISKQGITSSTFRTVPDQPLTSFELTFPQGPDSALAANGSLCTSTLTMPTDFTAQNGIVIHQSTPVNVTGCAHKATRARASRRSRHRGRHRRRHR